MHFEELYQRGYRGIVYLAGTHTESSSQRDDDYDETYVARDAKRRTLELEVHVHCNVYRPRTFDVRSEKVIAEEAYEALVQARGVLDTPAWVQAQEDKKKKTAEDAQLIKEVSPVCPACRRTLVPRQNSRDKSWFFGCSTFPNCRGSSPMTSATQRRLKKAGLIT